MNPPKFTRKCIRMQIFSKGKFYLGTDDASFFDLSIHFGKFRLEWGDNQRHTNESIKETTDRPGAFKSS